MRKKEKEERNKAQTKQRTKKPKTNATFLFACQGHFVFFRTGTLMCCKFYGKRVVGHRGGLRDELRNHADRKIF